MHDENHDNGGYRLNRQFTQLPWWVFDCWRPFDSLDVFVRLAFTLLLSIVACLDISSLAGGLLIIDNSCSLHLGLLDDLQTLSKGHSFCLIVLNCLNGGPRLYGFSHILFSRLLNALQVTKINKNWTTFWPQGTLITCQSFWTSEPLSTWQPLGTCQTLTYKL